MLKLTFTFSIRPVIGVTIKSEDYRTSLIFIMVFPPYIAEQCSIIKTIQYSKIYFYKARIKFTYWLRYFIFCNSCRYIESILCSHALITIDRILHAVKFCTWLKANIVAICHTWVCGRLLNYIFMFYFYVLFLYS